VLCHVRSGDVPGEPIRPIFQRLRDLGYVEGRTITIDYLSAEGRSERVPDLAADTDWRFLNELRKELKG
jgi:hypothetical protein